MKLLPTFKKRQPAYAYCRDADGVDDLWQVFHVATDRLVASIVFWDCDPERRDRTEADARLLVAALNAYRPAKHGRCRTRPPRSGVGRYVLVHRPEKECHELVDRAADQTLVWYAYGDEASDRQARNVAAARMVLAALNAFDRRNGGRP